MSERRLFLDRGIGVTRGVVTLDGRPERLLLHRHDDEARLMLGARLVARVASVEPAIATAFLDLGGGLEAILPFKPEARPIRGSRTGPVRHGCSQRLPASPRHCASSRAMLRSQRAAVRSRRPTRPRPRRSRQSTPCRAAARSRSNQPAP